MTAHAPAVRTVPLAARLGVAVIAAAVVNTLVALVAGALDDGGIGMGLTPANYLPATLVGVAVGAAGWTLVRRYAPGALRIVVPAVLAVTWVPDLLLLTMAATAANVAGLMLMHAAVATAVVLAMREA
ncbi:hypothetical protein LQ327_21600 [Actinomycetospora endophytica]|uniref:Secreted protein with PEP-CTERM sorting signal n=1 Tax=Actinomycetospora endophytica TaxID=2291215 RepID=A0ABS8PG39_9PSEU|nr:hypothetical protein [Actinomycetospora endophytica]MCD2195969.1 hypothetical protein [Actinomycetospora endophytica]